MLTVSQAWLEASQHGGRSPCYNLITEINAQIDNITVPLNHYAMSKACVKSQGYKEKNEKLSISTLKELTVLCSQDK